MITPDETQVPAANSSGQRPLHILEIVGNAIMGGMETHVRNLIRMLPKDEFRITCIAPNESPFTVILRELGCQVFITPVEDDPAWRSIQMAVEVIRNYDVDLIHAHMPRAHALAGIAACFTQRPVIATVHGMNVTTQEFGIWRLVGSQLTVVCQEAFGQALAMGVPLEQVRLIPNGVDTDIFVPGKSGEDFRKLIGIPPAAPLVGFVGRLEWEKTPTRFVELAGMVHQERPDAHFVLVGEGTLRTEVVRMIQEKRMQDEVHLASIRDNVWDVYPAFDLLVNTSRTEGMPLTLLEGMSCGLPVVAGRVGGVREIVEDGTSGLLVGQGDISSMAERVLRLLEDPERMRRMGRAGRQRVERYYNLRASTRKLAELFRQIARQHPASPSYLPSHLSRPRSRG